MLIIAVQKRPCIYDKSDQHYHNREYLKKSWEEIAFEVSESSKLFNDFLLKINWKINTYQLNPAKNVGVISEITTLNKEEFT